MMGKPNTNYQAKTDSTLLAEVGEFVKRTRLRQNMTQEELADRAGINRWTVSQLEGGQSISLSNLIRVLRSLKALHVFEAFAIPEVVDPLVQLKLANKQRQRARPAVRKDTSKSDW